ncbi:uncharacterized protein LOC100141920 [Tribolium castaneum]|uniref:Uncharacterized protein n=1 Tax=Tribolium castaneum TaxID=7070 RepID=A0A139WFU8_TRICA|nr:PREDICTED: uncharacterized protein LOC100141920 [Tribolium castaneum]KYB26721.1 hypothetical protein TcasGA2_TC033637 [Tribolium castaneum]|eukprot:XP_008195510.1 PREDICTED: uncharacterized protein LOC100141920 [Tribolium castaneum]
MNYLLHVLLLLGLIGVSKAHHFIKLVILAGLGLAGLWMVHTLAQDYGNLTHGGGGGGGKAFEKRSIDTHRGINWEFVLSRDPARCARSFICQLAAQDEDQLDEVGQNILRLTRLSAQQNSWASKQLLEALKHGKNALNPSQCMKIYKFCPYSSQTMTTLLKLFGG